jgi:hypothetical protein
LGLRIAADAAAGRKPAAATLVTHERKFVDVDQAHVGDLEVRDHRQRQEGDRSRAILFSRLWGEK